MHLRSYVKALRQSFQSTPSKQDKSTPQSKRVVTDKQMRRLETALLKFKELAADSGFVQDV